MKTMSEITVSTEQDSAPPDPVAGLRGPTSIGGGSGGEGDIKYNTCYRVPASKLHVSV